MDRSMPLSRVGPWISSCRTTWWSGDCSSLACLDDALKRRGVVVQVAGGQYAACVRQIDDTGIAAGVFEVQLCGLVEQIDDRGRVGEVQIATGHDEGALGHNEPIRIL